MEVVKEKLEASPSFKVGEYGFQIKFVQTEKTIAIHGFCLKSYGNPDDPEHTQWGKIQVKLATLQKPTEKLCKGLEKRHIRMGLSKEYVRKVGIKDGVTYYCSFVKKGQGFSVDHWHHHVDVERIIKTRISRHKQIKIAGDSKSDNKGSKMYCGHTEAYIEVCEDSVWVHKANEAVVDKNEGEFIRGKWYRSRNFWK